jgi:hypothetical protein
MTAAVTKERIEEPSPRFKASLTVVFYLLTIIAGGVVLFVHDGLGFAVVAACYLALTALFYDLLRPARKSLRLLVASHKIAENSSRVHKEVGRTI